MLHKVEVPVDSQLGALLTMPVGEVSARVTGRKAVDAWVDQIIAKVLYVGPEASPAAQELGKQFRDQLRRQLTAVILITVHDVTLAVARVRAGGALEQSLDQLVERGVRGIVDAANWVGGPIRDQIGEINKTVPAVLRATLAAVREDAIEWAAHDAEQRGNVLQAGLIRAIRR